MRLPTPLLPTLLVLPLLAPAAAIAQEPFARFSGEAIPTRVADPGRPAVGDIDGDGDLDLAVPSRSGQDRLFVNDGTGFFADMTASHLPTDVRPSRGHAFVDVDGDGDLDLVVAGDGSGPGANRDDRLWLNDGSGRFTIAPAGSMPADFLGTEKIVAADVDGDGDPDLVAMNSWNSANQPVPSRLYRNDGAGVFTDVSATAMPSEALPSEDLQVGDLDGDGDPDLVLSTLAPAPDSLRIYENDGTGVFTPAASDRLPALRDFGRKVWLADLEGDGDLDILAYLGFRLTALVNDGTGRFAEEPFRIPSPVIATLELAEDLDGDGDVDLMVSDGGRPLVLRNDGNGVFVPGVEVAAVGDLAADLDGDGDSDLLVLARPDVLRNDGTGLSFAGNAPSSRGPEILGVPQRSALADVDGDGDLDAWIGSGDVGADRLLLNDGRGFFQLAVPQPNHGGRAVTTVAFGDVDADGDQDALLGGLTDTPETRLLLNDGRGGFSDVTLARMPRYRAPTTNLLVRDFDGDGDLDVLEINYARESVLMANDGSGRFTLTSASAFGNWRPPAAGAAAFDADRDGDLDVALAVLSQPVLLFLNDGSGRFQRSAVSAIPAIWLRGQDIAAHDFDADGDDDLVVLSLGERPRLYLNDGAGVFSDASDRLPQSVPSVRLHVVDHDLDGDLDLVTSEPGSLVVLANDGGAVFGVVQRMDSPGAVPVASGDIDGDRDPDLLLGLEDAPLDVAVGRRAQLHVTRPVEVGGFLPIDVHAVGRAVGPAFALTFLAAVPAQIELPLLGRLGLDPNGVLEGPSVSFGFSAGVASVRLAVPADPALAGVELYLQALLADDLGPRLTNALMVRLRD